MSTPIIQEYATIYYFTLCDVNEVERSVYIKKRGYEGDATLLIGTDTPLVITYSSSEDFKFKVFRPSTCEINFYINSEQGFDLFQLIDADERMFLVEVYEGANLEWRGFMSVNGFEYNLTGGLFECNLIANDGLNSLEDIEFIDDNGKPYGNQDLTFNNGFEFPCILIITEALNKLGLALDIWVCVDSYEQSMLKTGDVRDAEPLANTYLNVKTFIKENANKEIPYWFASGEVWNCKEVLDNVLFLFGAKIYQEKGTWRIKSVNADTNQTDLYWRKYNTNAVYLGNYEPIEDVITIGCDDPRNFLVNNDHSIIADEAYSAFRINYEYTILRTGDSLFNLLKNSNFDNLTGTTSELTPLYWYKWRANSNNKYLRFKPITLTGNDTGGVTTGLSLGEAQSGQINHLATANAGVGLRHEEIRLVEAKEINFSFYANFSEKTSNIQSFLVFKLRLITDDTTYNLVNFKDGIDFKFQWENSNDDFFRSKSFFVPKDYAENYNPLDEWAFFNIKIPSPPSSGKLEFMIHGLGTRRRTNENRPPFSRSIPYFGGYDFFRRGVHSFISYSKLEITSISLGIIPTGNDIPLELDYIYENADPRYFLQEDPLKVYNGDVLDNLHVSTIIVPTNNTGQKNLWQDFHAQFTKSSLGLIICKHIMKQYAKPRMILEGDVKVENARFGALYEFEAIPGKKFMLNKADFNKYSQILESATFLELTNDVLPDGGTEGGNNLDPNWQPTGVEFCQLDENFVNTGFLIRQEQDINPNSETYEQIRDVVSDEQDTDACPLLQPRLYYFASSGGSLNLSDLEYKPFAQNAELVSYIYTNIENNYLYFLLLKSEGVVSRIFTNTSPNNVISDWVALADVTINGYLYRVYRTDYTMSEFENFEHYFLIQ